MRGISLHEVCIEGEPRTALRQLTHFSSRLNLPDSRRNAWQAVPSMAYYTDIVLQTAVCSNGESEQP